MRLTDLHNLEFGRWFRETDGKYGNETVKAPTGIYVGPIDDAPEHADKIYAWASSLNGPYRWMIKSDRRGLYNFFGMLDGIVERAVLAVGKDDDGHIAELMDGKSPCAVDLVAPAFVNNFPNWITQSKHRMAVWNCASFRHMLVDVESAWKNRPLSDLALSIMIIGGGGAAYGSPAGSLLFIETGDLDSAATLGRGRVHLVGPWDRQASTPIFPTHWFKIDDSVLNSSSGLPYGDQLNRSFFYDLGLYLCKCIPDSAASAGYGSSIGDGFSSPFVDNLLEGLFFHNAPLCRAEVNRGLAPSRNGTLYDMASLAVKGSDEYWKWQMISPRYDVKSLPDIEHILTPRIRHDSVMVGALTSFVGRLAYQGWASPSIDVPLYASQHAMYYSVDFNLYFDSNGTFRAEKSGEEHSRETQAVGGLDRDGDVVSRNETKPYWRYSSQDRPDDASVQKKVWCLIDTYTMKYPDLINNPGTQMPYDIFRESVLGFGEFEDEPLDDERYKWKGCAVRFWTISEEFKKYTSGQKDKTLVETVDRVESLINGQPEYRYTVSERFDWPLSYSAASVSTKVPSRYAWKEGYADGLAAYCFSNMTVHEDVRNAYDTRWLSFVGFVEEETGTDRDHVLQGISEKVDALLFNSASSLVYDSVPDRSKQILHNRIDNGFKDISDDEVAKFIQRVNDDLAASAVSIDGYLYTVFDANNNPVETYYSVGKNRPKTFRFPYDNVIPVEEAFCYVQLIGPRGPDRFHYQMTNHGRFVTWQWHWKGITGEVDLKANGS